MNFKAIKCLVTLALNAYMLLPMVTQAHDLNIYNNTRRMLSFSVNNICAESFGTIYGHGHKIIYEKDLNKVCDNFKNTCNIMGYDHENCNGKPMGGIQYLTEHSFNTIPGRGGFGVVPAAIAEDNLTYDTFIPSG